jgi:succinoglycan biosynthesis protein ExoA
VSVILPVRNEVRFIDATIESLLMQGTPDFDLEILAVEGRSEDGTAEKLAAWSARDPRVRVLVNPIGTTPAAMNIGLREARGEFVCVFGAHATYSPDYVATCLRELRARGAVGCSGKVVTRPGGSSLGARLVAWCMAHPFGSSGGSVRTRSSGFVDHLPFPVFLRRALLEVGGFDETLLRNQDNDMSQRLRAIGGRLYLTGETEATYLARESIGRFARYAFAGGRWNATSLRRNPRSMGVHHLVPLAFVLTLGAALTAATIAGLTGAAGRPWLLLAGGMVGLHLVIGGLAGLQVALRERAPGALWLPGVFLLFHSVYGAGTLWGLLTNTRKGAASVPEVVRGGGRA